MTDTLPKFGNGLVDFHKYLQKNIKRKFSKDPNNPIYKIKYTFIVDTNGQLQQPCITNNLDHPNYDKLQADFATAFEKCPKWRSAYKDNKKVIVRLNYVMDIKFGY